MISKHLLLQVSDDEIKGAITKEADMELFREHMSSGNSLQKAAKTSKIFPSGRKLDELDIKTDKVSLTAQEACAGLIMLKYFRLMFHRRKRARLLSNGENTVTLTNYSPSCPNTEGLKTEQVMETKVDQLENDDTGNAKNDSSDCELDRMVDDNIELVLRSQPNS